MSQLRGVLQEEVKATNDAKDHRQQDVEVKFGEGLNLVGGLIEDKLAEVGKSCEKFIGEVESIQTEVLKEACKVIDEALAEGAEFVKAGKSKASVADGELQAGASDVKRMKALLADIKTSVEMYGDPTKYISSLEAAESKVGKMLDSGEQKANKEFEEFSATLDGVDEDVTDDVAEVWEVSAFEEVCAEAKTSVQRKMDEGKEKEVTRFRASEVMLSERVEGLVRAVEQEVMDMSGKQEIVCAQDVKRLESAEGIHASGLTMLAEEFKGVCTAHAGNAEVEEQVKVIDALLLDRKSRISGMVTVGGQVLNDEKNRQQVAVKGWLSEHVGEMRKLWSDHVDLYKEHSEKIESEDSEFVKAKFDALDAKVEGSVGEVREGVAKALEVCKSSCKQVGGNKETAAALESVAKMKEMVAKSAAKVADDLGRMAEKIEGVIKEHHEEERRETIRLQEEEQRKKMEAAAAARAAQQQQQQGGGE